MGYFFRRSAKVGPFRLNFSKSGVGASVGVKGARLTMTPRGTTYVTAGSHGFYYRETLPNRGGIQVPSYSPNCVPPQSGRTEDAISNASVSDLVDSSSERLIQQLNERARMFNPAWLLYVAAVMSLSGLSMLPTVPTVPTVPKLPDVTQPFSAERKSNTLDEYSMLTARYSEPDSILFAEADPKAPIPVGTARYNSAHLDVVFVPNGCVEAYEQVTKGLADNSRRPGLAKGKKKGLKQCVPLPNAGWTAVRYINSAGSYDIPTDIATARLDGITVKQSSPPIVERRSLPKTQSHPRPEMQSNNQSRAAEEQMRQNMEQGRRSSEAVGRRVLYLSSAVLLGAMGLFVAGVFVHKNNAEKRTSRLFYELGETERQRYSIVQTALTHLAASHRIWRVKGKSETSDWKRNAGASSLVSRVPISVGCSHPPRVETNVAVPSISMGHVRLFFLPDVILYWEAGTFGAVGYQDFRVEQSTTRFIENGYVPADATIVDRTWRYVNKNGGPDRRFNNNVQLPVAQYGVLILASSRGLNIHLHTSNAQASLAVVNCWRNLYSSTGTPQRPQSTDQSRIETPSGPGAQAFKMLGLDASASPAEISAAYRHLAQMYHPDKVAGLAPEFQVLADKRMKEINAAYEVLRGRGNSTQTA